MSTPLRFAFSGLAFAAAAALAAPAFAQLELPRPSPLAKVSQRVGLTDVSLEYSSPGVKGRKIWGAVVPYDKMWRTGANAATKITFSKDVTFGGKPVPAGTYAVATIPTAKAWTVILNKNVELNGDGGNYKEADDAARVSVTPKPMPVARERMTFLFSDTTEDSANLDLEWEKLRVTVPIKTATGEQALANIQKTLDGTWSAYNQAARYILDSKKDYDTGLKYVEQSIALKEGWFNTFTKAQLLAAKGNYKDALPLAQKADAIGSKDEKSYFLGAEVRKALGEWKNKK